jgi:branched-chain amino acid transport system substrate-binding protein
MARIGKIVTSLCVGLLALGGACSSKESDRLRVGVILPMSDKNATFGDESWKGMQLAAEDLKKEGFDPVLILKDDKSSKTEAGNQAKLLIENEGVHVLIGSVASSNTQQVAIEARESGIPLITPASTNDSITVDGGPLVSRICFKDSFQGAVLANFALGQGFRNAVVCVDRGQVYSVGLAENFRTEFEKGGGKVHFEYYATGDTDFANTVQNVASRKPDVIFISGYYSEAGPMIRQGKEKWAGVPILGGDGLDSPELVGLVGDTNATIYLVSHFAADAPDPRVREFAKRYEQRFGKLPGAMAALGYDVLVVLADAVRRCADPKNPEQLGKAIRETKEVVGITGPIDLTTPDRTPLKDAVIVKVDGGLKYHATIAAK